MHCLESNMLKGLKCFRCLRDALAQAESGIRNQVMLRFLNGFSLVYSRLGFDK